jgi:hypothetical protein
MAGAGCRGHPSPLFASVGPKTLQDNGGLAYGTMPYLAGRRTIALFIERSRPQTLDRGNPESSATCPHSWPTTSARRRGGALAKPV